ncbi:MAG: PF20097 family protein [Candidatus Thorarchaeota archaeon]
MQISEDYYCPKCKRELEEGYLIGRGEISWSKMHPKHGLGKPLVKRIGSLFGERYISCKRCASCRIIIYPEFMR